MSIRFWSYPHPSTSFPSAERFPPITVLGMAERRDRRQEKVEGEKMLGKRGGRQDGTEEYLFGINCNILNCLFCQFLTHDRQVTTGLQGGKKKKRKRKRGKEKEEKKKRKRKR